MPYGASCGVRRGSILGPLLFLMCINYLKTCSPASYARMYTDDTYLTPCAIDPEMLQFELNHYLEIVDSWLYASKLSLKTKKTKYLINSWQIWAQ